MTVITRTVNTIIENAYKLIGLYSEDRALEQSRTTEGLYLLNALLDHYASNDKRIAYNSLLSFNLVIGQTTYSFSKKVGASVDSNRIVDLKYIILEDDDKNYPVNIQPDQFYFNNIRKTNVINRPIDAYFQNDIDESRIIFFTKPAKAYPITLKAKFVIDAVELSQPLDEVPAYMHLFLGYALGRILHDHYPGSVWTSTQEAQYQEMLANIINAADTSLESFSGIALTHYNRGISREDFLSA